MPASCEKLYGQCGEVVTTESRVVRLVRVVKISVIYCGGAKGIWVKIIAQIIGRALIYVSSPSPRPAPLTPCCLFDPTYLLLPFLIRSQYLKMRYSLQLGGS